MPHLSDHTHTEADREQEWDRDVGPDWWKQRVMVGIFAICVAFRQKSAMEFSPLRLHDLPESAAAGPLLRTGESKNKRDVSFIRYTDPAAAHQLSSVSVKCQECGISFLCETTFLLRGSQKCSAYSLHIRNNTAIRYLLPAMAVAPYLRDKKSN